MTLLNVVMAIFFDAILRLLRRILSSFDKLFSTNDVNVFNGINIWI